MTKRETGGKAKRLRAKPSRCFLPAVWHRFTSDLQVVIVISETRRVSNYQPAKVLEADVELVPTADLPPVGAVDVICRDRRARSFLGFLLCAATTGYQGGRCPDEHICQMNDRKPFGLIKPIPETLLVP